MTQIPNGKARSSPRAGLFPQHHSLLSFSRRRPVDKHQHYHSLGTLGTLAQQVVPLSFLTPVRTNSGSTNTNRYRNFDQEAKYLPFK